MRRTLLLLVVALASLSVAVAPVAAGRNSGPEQLAKGRGALLTTSAPQETPILSVFCLANDPTVCGTPVEVATATATTEVRQSFDFDARLGPQTDALDTTDGPSGRIKVTYEATTITSVAPSGFGNLCTSPAFTITPACPAFGTTTTTEEATATAAVTCLLTVQNRATIGGHITRFEGSFTPTRGILLNVTDNTIARRQVGQDRFLATFVTDVPNTCPAPAADHPITTGDIYVDQS